MNEMASQQLSFILLEIKHNVMIDVYEYQSII